MSSRPRHIVLAAAALILFACKEAEPPPPAPTETETSETTEAPDKTVPTCRGECLPVPEGIAGLVFGMKHKALKRSYRKLRQRTMAKRRVVVDRSCAETQRPPGSRYEAKTELGGEKATCTLRTLPDDGLVDIACDLGGRRKAVEHDETAWVLYQSLARQYGPGTAVQNRIQDGFLTARWESENAFLALRASRRGSRSRIALVNQSARLEEALADEKQGVADACAARAAEAAKNRDAREQRLRDKADRFERDLRPPLEVPKD